MNEVQVFNFKENQVRTQKQNNDIWLCLKDVCDILELTQPSKVKERLNEKGVNSIPTLTKGGTQNLIYINESNLYKVIFQSRKPQAEQFTEWVTSEVLPQIRKTGSYNAPQVQESEELKKLREKTEYVRQLNNLIDRYNGDTAPVDAILGLGHNTTTQKKQDVKVLKNKDILNDRDIYKTIDAFLKSHRISEGDFTRDVYSKYCDYCHTLNVTPRTRQAFVLRMKEQTRFYTIQYKGNSVIRRR